MMTVLNVAVTMFVCMNVVAVTIVMSFDIIASNIFNCY